MFTTNIWLTAQDAVAASKHPSGPCGNRDCGRPLCVGYRIGYDEGWADGYAAGAAAGER